MKKAKIIVFASVAFLFMAYPKNVLAAEDMTLQSAEETVAQNETEKETAESEMETAVMPETEKITESEVQIETETEFESEKTETDVDTETEKMETEEVIEPEESIPETVYDTAVSVDKYENKDVYNFVVRMYDKFLSRSADAEGLDVWYNKLVSHEMEAADIVDGFLSSKEFQAKELNTEEYLNILYEGIMGRKPDSTGMTEWTQTLENGVSRKYISAQFINSQEFIKLCDTYKVSKGNISLTENRDQNYDVTQFVSHFYNYCLERSGDVKGLNDWTGWLLGKSMTGVDIAHGFLFSNEFVSKGLGDAEFIETLYRTLLSRTSDKEGVATWTECLENGVSNNYILAGFAHSKEFTGLCDAYGIVRGNVVLTENRDKNYELTSSVARLFKECLGYKPQGEELNNKIGQLFKGELSGVDMAIEFFNSNFYQAKNKSADAFVADIYNLILHRQPSEEEISAGVARVKNISREEAINRVLLSKEFSEKCKNYGIELMNYMNIPAMWYAKEILDQVGWDMEAAFRWTYTAIDYQWTSTPPDGVSHTQWYGKYGYENRRGNCYVMASAFYWMAKINGWDIHLVEGYVPVSGGYLAVHGWCEVVMDGELYVFDPYWGRKGNNGYKIQYGQKGTYRYTDYSRVD